MSTLWQNIQHRVLRSNSKLNLLIGINIAVFLLVNVLDSLFKSAHIKQFSDEYLALPGSLSKLGSHFWTPFTYMFVHAGIFHILFNLLWLYWFGQIFEEYLGDKRTIGLYLMGGLGGALFFILAFNTLPVFTNVDAGNRTILVGASAAIMAIIAGTATLMPDYTISLMFIGPVKLKWLALFFVIVDFLGLVGLNNPGGELSHLGGAFIGFIYVKQLQKGNDWLDNLGKLFKPKSKLKVVSKNSSKAPVGRPRQEEVDSILDKISKSGYDNLSKQEKEVLFRASKNE